MSSSFNPSVFEGFRPREDDLEAGKGVAPVTASCLVTVRSNAGHPTAKNDILERLKTLFKVRQQSIIAGNSDQPVNDRHGTWKTLKRKVVAITGNCWSEIRPRAKYDEREPNPDLEAAAEHRGPAKKESRGARCAKAAFLEVKKIGEELKKLTSRRKKTFHMYISPNYKHGMDYEGLVAIVDEELFKFRKKEAARKAAEEARRLEAERQVFLRAQRVALGGRLTVESVRARDWDWNFDDEDDYYPAW